jgi:FemAB-related protein (PEP-CTERM system-associated)
MTLVIRPSDPGDDAARDAFVTACERATFFHLAGWRRAVEGVFGHTGRDLLAWRDNQVVGVLPMMGCRSMRGRKSLISVPYSVYGGPVGEDSNVELALFEVAERAAISEDVGRLELRCSVPTDLPGCVPCDLYATFTRELPGTVDEILSAMPKKARADARKARKDYGLELSTGNWYLPDLVRLFQHNKRSLGTPALPLRWFERLIEELPGQVVVHVVLRKNVPLAACMSFLFRDQVLAYYSGTGPDVDRQYKASAFLYLSLQEWCVEQGYRIFDFGRSRKDSGAFDFKRRQGFEPRDLPYRFRLVHDTKLPSLTPSNPKTRFLTDTWRRLPEGLARGMGGWLSRYLV